MEGKSTCFSVEEASAVDLTCKNVKDKDNVKYLSQAGTSIQNSDTYLILYKKRTITCTTFGFSKITYTTLSQTVINFNGNFQLWYNIIDITGIPLTCTQKHGQYKMLQKLRCFHTEDVDRL